MDEYENAVRLRDEEIGLGNLQAAEVYALQAETAAAELQRGMTPDERQRFDADRVGRLFKTLRGY